MMIPQAASWLVSMLTAQLAQYQPESQDPSMRVNNIPSDQIMDSYDFIIVGAGTSGSIVANRLSEIDEWSVLVIEAGIEENVYSDTPILTRDNWFGPMDWNFTTTKQKRACQAYGGLCFIPRGKVVGGSSATNLMMYVRGNKIDYDGWEDQGNIGWNYGNSLKYFKKAEDMMVKELSSSNYHGTGGPMTVDYPEYMTPLRELYISAGQELGYQNRDYNGELQTSISYPQFTMRNGARCSSGKAYLRQLKDRKNVHVALGSMVTKILFNPDKSISGVEFMRDGKKMVVKTKKEVVLAAGAINSPKLLMLSGIGPQDHLKKMNIPLIHNSVVGNTLQDQISVPVYYKIKEPMALTKSMFEDKEAINMYAEKGIGPLSSPVGIEAVGFFNLKGKINDSVPDVQMVVMSYVPSDSSDSLMVITTNKLRPTSVGTLRLKSADPMEPPLIDPNYLEEGTDYEDTVEACLLAMKFAQTKALKDAILGIDTTMTPECTAKDEKAMCQCLTEKYSNAMYSPVSATKMAHPKMAANSVVCPRLRVHGVKGLRLVDESIMPSMPSGDTHGPTIMIGEMGSDYIKEQWKPEALN